MLTFDRTFRIAAFRMVSSQRKTGCERYRAVDLTTGKIYRHKGSATVVTATPALEALYGSVDTQVHYHRTHPDERALSPSDLALIAWPSVTEVWAHSPEGGATGTRLGPGLRKQKYLEALTDLGGGINAHIQL